MYICLYICLYTQTRSVARGYPRFCCCEFGMQMHLVHASYLSAFQCSFLPKDPAGLSFSLHSFLVPTPHEVYVSLLLGALS